MTTPNQELADLICKALIDAGVASEKEVASLKSRILSGKVKAEDWSMAVENSLLKPQEVETHGN